MREPALYAAAATAAKGNDHTVIARVLIIMNDILGNQGGKFESALALQQPTRIAVTLAGDAPRLLSDYLEQRGTLLLRLGRSREAVAAFSENLKVLKMSLGPDHPNVGKALGTLGVGLKHIGDFAPAETYYQRALASVEASLGPEHPDLSPLLFNLAYLCNQLGHYREAENMVVRSDAINRKVYDPDHPDHGLTASLWADTLISLGEYDRAGPLVKDAIASLKRTAGPNNRRYGAGLRVQARLLAARGHYRGAIDVLHSSLAIFEGKFGHDYFYNVAIHLTLGETHRRFGHLQQAHDSFQRGLTIAGNGQGKRLLRRAMVMWRLGETEVPSAKGSSARHTSSMPLRH